MELGPFISAAKLTVLWSARIWFIRLKRPMLSSGWIGGRPPGPKEIRFSRDRGSRRVELKGLSSRSGAALRTSSRFAVAIDFSVAGLLVSGLLVVALAVVDCSDSLPEVSSSSSLPSGSL